MFAFHILYSRSEDFDDNSWKDTDTESEAEKVT